MIKDRQILTGLCPSPEHVYEPDGHSAAQILEVLELHASPAKKKKKCLVRKYLDCIQIHLVIIQNTSSKHYMVARDLTCL